MLSKRVILLLLCIGTSSAISYSAISSNFVWAENLICDTKLDQLWVSDATLGTLSAVKYNSAVNSYETTVHLSGLKGVNGVALDKSGTRLFAAATLETKEHVIIEVNRNIPQNYSVITTLSDGGNGVAIDFTSGLLYATTEGGFKPNAGKVFEVDIDAKTSRIYADELFATDGAFIDQSRRLMYVSQVVGSRVLVFDLAAASLKRSFDLDNVDMLDDYTLTKDAKYIIGADFKKGNVVRFPVDSMNKKVSAEILIEGLTAPTSVRYGCDTTYLNDNHVFVTEGGGITKNMDTRRVLDVDLE